MHAPASSVTSCTIFPQLGLRRSGSSCLPTAWQHQDPLSDCFRLQVTREAPRKALDSLHACRLVSVKGNSLCSRFEALALVFPTSQILNQTQTDVNSAEHPSKSIPAWYHLNSAFYKTLTIHFLLEMELADT